MKRPTPLVIASGRPLALRALEHDLRSQPALRVVDSAESVADLYERVQRKRPDVILLDTQLDGAPVFSLGQPLRDYLPACRLVLLDLAPRDATLLAALQAGFAAVTTARSAADLAAVIDQLMGGKQPLVDQIMERPELIRTIIVDYGIRSSMAPAMAPVMPLSAREYEVLRYLCDGLTPRAIAVALELSYNTVRSYQQNVYKKLGVSTSAAAIAATRDRRLLHLSPPNQAAAPFSSPDEPATLFTPREYEVLRCLCDGLTPKAIAAALELSYNTVRTHLKSVYKKLGVSTRAAAINVTLHRRLVHLSPANQAESSR